MPGEQTFAFAGEKGQKGKAGRNPLSYHETKHSGPVTGAKEKTALPVISLEEKKNLILHMQMQCLAVTFWIRRL